MDRRVKPGGDDMRGPTSGEVAQPAIVRRFFGAAMKQRSRPRASVKSRGCEAATRKGRDKAEGTRPRSSSGAGEEKDAERLAGELSAISEILRLIANSPSDVTAVLRSVAEQAAHICQAQNVDIHLVENEHLRTVTWFGERKRVLVFPLDRSSVAGRSVCDMRAISIDDLQNVGDEYASGRDIARREGICSIVAVPLIRENRALGAIAAYEQLEIRSQEIAKLNAQLEARVADQVGEIERMGRLRRFLPPQVADLIVASGNERQLESHRREITALFCDLRGFTGFSESSDPEDVMMLLRQYHETIGTIIIKYSGTLERYAGDGVMVVFNDPVPVDNPALQAVRMALEMRQALGVLIEKWRRLGHDLGFGIGIAHGYATLGTIGFEGRFDYAAIGTVSNVASRLCDEAKPGQILISPRVLMAVEDAVGVEPVGDFTLKGISRPLGAFNVVGRKVRD
jgi:class 3 adenylate cyclase